MNKGVYVPVSEEIQTIAKKKKKKKEKRKERPINITKHSFGLEQKLKY